jgi:hypothetical protein
MSDLSKIGEQALEMLKELAKGIGVGVKQLYPLAVKECVIEGAKTLCQIVISVICFIISIIFMFSTVNSIENWSNFDTRILSFILLCVGVLATFIWMINAFTLFFTSYDNSGTVNKLFNPKYHAVKKIIQMARNLR